MSRTVVVFPLVPVTAITGIVDSLPGGYSMSMIGAADVARLALGRDACASGCPAPAFTSMITAPFSRNGTEMSSVSTSMPAMSRPTIPAAISQAVTLSGCISSVRSIDVPPVERLAVPRRQTTCSSAAAPTSSVRP